MKFGLSTGIFHKYYGEEELNRKISHMAIWDSEYIEILYTRPYILNIPINAENKSFLKSRKVILHAPFFRNKSNEKYFLNEEDLKKLVEIANELDAIHIVLHADVINDFEILKKFENKFVIENMDKNFSDYPLENIDINLLKENGLCFDRHHSNSLSGGEIKPFLEHIKEIHFNFDELTKFLVEGTKEYDFLKNYDVPIILETRIRSLDRTNQVMNKINEIFEK